MVNKRNYSPFDAFPGLAMQLEISTNGIPRPEFPRTAACVEWKSAWTAREICSSLQYAVEFDPSTAPGLAFALVKSGVAL
jgi:hypothetical protein